MHTVLETPSFANSARSQGLTEDEKFAIVKAIADDPQKGDVIKGTGGARKIRFGGKGKGKRSAFRVVTYYVADDIPVFLLDLYSKGEKINLSQSERNELKKLLGGIANDYRRSTRAKVAQLREIAS
jgi:hypothetical protein